eukprot:COSAG01_NODE_4762_length_4758_cov_2.512127_3_plen_37_part_00
MPIDLGLHRVVVFLAINPSPPVINELYERGAGDQLA